MKPWVYSSICLLLLGAAVWWMCAEVVWLGDDLDYKYMMKGEIWQSWGRIKTLRRFFESQWIHYLHINGRFVAHSLVQLFNARLGQQWFAVCNAIVYMLFAMMIGKAGGVQIRENPGGILSAACLSILCFVTKMMPTCQIGYIWAMLANLIWLRFFFRKRKPGWLMTTIMSISGIMAGNWQESVSIGVCSGVGIWWLIQLADCIKRDVRPFDLHRSCMLLGYLAGTATNVLAPSTLGRVGNIDISPVDQFLITSYSLPGVILLLAVAVMLKTRRSNLCLLSFSPDKRQIPCGVLTCGLVFLLAFNLLIGVYSNRQLFGANLFAAILTFRILPKHRFHSIINAVLAVGVIFTWCVMAKGIIEVRRQYDEIVKMHSESKDGSVCLDRKRTMPFGYPLAAKYYEDILGQFDNDLHHSLMKDFKHVRKGHTLKLKPTAEHDCEQVESYANGHFCVTLKEPHPGEAPRTLIVYGHYPFGIKAKPRKIEVTKYSKKTTLLSTAVIIPEFPFFSADSIKITSPRHKTASP